MISKERLEELIRQEATIYSARIMVREIPLNNLIQIYTEYGENIIVFGYDPNDWEGLKDCYETKEEAEWHLKYHATRTEELNLPMWEDREIIFSFFDKKGCEICLDCAYGKVRVERYKNGLLDKELCEFELTEENYEKACDLCLKLFEGEEKC